MITIVGGVYRERCLRPSVDQVFGSAGRAAVAIANFGGKVELHSYLDDWCKEDIANQALLAGFSIVPTDVDQGLLFQYAHGLVTPLIRKPRTRYDPIRVSAEKIIRFGMLEGAAIVDSDYAVYDPQSVHDPEPFHANGSTAKHLALILNRHEAQVMCSLENATVEEMAESLARSENAEVVVIKMGPMGALVYADKNVSIVPAYKTEQVWKIGSGDTFVAHFAHAWMEEQHTPHKAAEIASKATAYYCLNRGFPNQRWLESYEPNPIVPSERFRKGYKPKVYLAGPFFTLAQLWIIEEARNNLLGMGLDVFSPYHDVGLGTAGDVVGPDLDGIHDCDLVFAIVDGLDPGTVYEIGYARAQSKPVVVYSENETKEDLKMMEGSDCVMCDDYVSAIYRAVWIAAEL